MRIPAVSFDPPVGSPLGVSPLHAAAAISGTAVSPDGRNGSPGYRRAAREAEAEAEAEAPAAPAASEAPPAEPLPVYYPPLSAQRAVLDRPPVAAHVVPPPVPAPREDRHTETAPRPPVPGSELDQALRRVIGTA